MLNDNVAQGSYGEALIQVMACAAGLTWSKKHLDVDGTDLSVHYPGRAPNGRRHAQIDMQIKSDSAPSIVDESISYSLPARNYDDLVGEPGIEFPVPRILVVVKTPKNIEEYMVLRQENYELNHLAYWVSLMNEEPVADSAKYRTAHVPLSNPLSAETLQNLVTRKVEEWR
ncbi:DUF4365 domain-containing protein [Kineococcus aurantiacus]|uniref:DUF4365 domain-containing protein n=1 Tax=Kineococcus aurantiacus TaxID=37633 RepID=A0A7Y9DLI0_9ACTN|nr:hypothetical protein [Kineococcus aurantiacus]